MNKEETVGKTEEKSFKKATLKQQENLTKS